MVHQTWTNLPRQLLPLAFLLATCILTGCCIGPEGLTPESPLAGSESPIQIPPWDPGISGQVLFHSDRFGNLQIFVLDLSNGQVTRLTNSAGNDVEPAWSPDGTQVAYVCGISDTHADLCVMQNDGLGSIHLTDRPGAVGAPRWSPDGSRIMFHAFWDGNPIKLYTINVDSSGLAEIPVGHGNNLWADWSPDGKRITFVSDRDGNDEIYVANSDGSNLVRLTESPGRDRYPRWSPDGKRIVFTSDRNGVAQIFTIHPDKQGTVPITDETGLDSVPTWADGKIVFATARNADQDKGTLALLDPDNGKILNLLPTTTGQEDFPDWKP